VKEKIFSISTVEHVEVCWRVETEVELKSKGTGCSAHLVRNNLLQNRHFIRSRGRNGRLIR